MCCSGATKNLIAKAITGSQVLTACEVESN